MGKSIITGITALMLLISLMLIGITVASIITGENTEATTEDNFDQMTKEVIDEISTYIQIKDQKGKYCNANGEQKIEKIALLISPLITQEIDLSQLTIQLNDGESVIFLVYTGNVKNLESNSIFDHPIWDDINGSNFGFIPIIDLDGSLVNYNIINDCSDNVYVVFKLPRDMIITKNEKLIVTLFPSTGITRTTVLEAPLPIKQIVTFE